MRISTAAAAAVMLAAAIGAPAAQQQAPAAQQRAPAAQQQVPAGQQQTAADPAAFVEQATQAGLLQLAISRLAVARMRDTDIARFGNYVAQVFNGANEAVASAAGDIEPPRALDRERQGLYDALEREGDATFDAAYLRLQGTGIDEAMALYSGYARAAAPGALKDAATRYADDIARLRDAYQKLAPTKAR